MPKRPPLKACPHCGGSLLPPKTNTPPDWRPRLAKFLAGFLGQTMPLTAHRLVNAGIIHRVWLSQPAGYRRLNQMQAEGWLESAGHGFYLITEKGYEVATERAKRGDLYPPINHLAPDRTGPPPEHLLDLPPRPSEWQVFFLKELINYPADLVGLPAVIRHMRKDGYLGKGGTAQIRMLVAEGWVGWIGERLVLTEAAKKLLTDLGETLPADLPTVDRALGMHDQPPPTD